MRPEIPACRLLILDLDNTLIRERDYLDGAYSAVAELLAGKSGSDAGVLHARMLEMLDSQGRERLFDKICFLRTNVIVVVLFFVSLFACLFC